VNDTGTIRPARILASASATNVVGILPLFLVGTSSVLLRTDLGIHPAQLGLAVATFMAFTAAFSIPGGRFTERLGAGRSLALVAAGSGVVMASIATLARSLTHLVVLLALGGLVNSMANPASNLALARGTFTRPGLSFGLKQASMPAASLLAGASVPLVALTLGWRWGFGIGALLAAATAVTSPHGLDRGSAGGRRRARTRDVPIGPLVLLALAFGLGTAGAISLGSFLVGSLVADGVDAGTAGWMLAVGSAVGMASRIGGGWLTDHHRDSALPLTAAMLMLGAVGYLVLGRGGPELALLGAVLGFAGGWGWVGLLFFAVVRLNPSAPAAATGIVSTGGESGSSAGPLAFGLVVASAGYPVAWQLVAAAAVAARPSSWSSACAGSAASHRCRLPTPRDERGSSTDELAW
jgi:cyanate permease